MVRSQSQWAPLVSKNLSTTLMTSTLEASNRLSYTILVGDVGAPFDPIEFSSRFRMTWPPLILPETPKSWYATSSSHRRWIFFSPSKSRRAWRMKSVISLSPKHLLPSPHSLPESIDFRQRCLPRYSSTSRNRHPDAWFRISFKISFP